MTTATKRVLAVLAEGNGLSVFEIAKATGLTVEQVRMAVPLLREAEYLVTVPSVTRYFITDAGQARLRHVPVTSAERRARKARERQARRDREAAAETVSHVRQIPNSVFALAGAMGGSM